MFLFSLFLACGEKSEDTAVSEDTAAVDTEAPQVEGNSVCEEDYAFCGNIVMPDDLVGTPRSMAVALFDSLEPAGPPAVTVTEIATPEVSGGEGYEIEISSLVASGSYYIWVFLYMEGGGEWMPVSGIDYSGHSADMIVFDGSPIVFDDINLVLAP